MKALLALLLCLAALPLPAEDAWTLAKSAYDAGDFSAAAAHYQTLQANGHSSAALDYNLGNTFTRLGQIENAIRHYRRAEWQSPRDPDLLANFDRLRESSGAVIAPLPLSRRIAAVLSPTVWQGLWFAACGLLAAIGILRRHSKALRAASAWLIPALVLGLLVSLAGMWASRPAGIFREAVLRGNEITARFEPLDDATARFSLPGGSVVLLGESVRDWIEIHSAENRGWVKQNDLLPLNIP